MPGTLLLKRAGAKGYTGVADWLNLTLAISASVNGGARCGASTTSRCFQGGGGCVATMTTYGAVESAGHEPATPMSYVSLLPDVEDDRQRRIPSMRACATMALVAGVGVAAWSAGGRLTAGSTVNLHDIAVPKATDEVSGPEVKVSSAPKDRPAPAPPCTQCAQRMSSQRVPLPTTVP